MRGLVIVDTNLLVLLVVGSASKDYVGRHKRLKEYSIDDFEMLGLVISQFSDLVVLPHILAEVSNLVRNIGNPARMAIQAVLKDLIDTTAEVSLESILGTRRDEFGELGLTDAMILHLCSLVIDGISPTLLTVDARLADSAHTLGYSVIDFKQEFMTQ